jgi:hypothetical protein
MRQVLAVVVGLLLAGMISGAAVPLLPRSVRQPWFIWGIVATSIALSLYVAARMTKTPPE